MPFKDDRNPWLSAYPFMARRGDSTACRSSFHALLAQAAGNLAQLGHKEKEVFEMSISLYTIAVRELSETVAEQEYDFDIVLASILTLIMAEVLFLQVSQKSY